ncbi:MAG: DEAD/DEAH box helicase [Patescibacteria group bacterium]|jgi:ATP-dependent RNA helicase RhlE
MTAIQEEKLSFYGLGISPKILEILAKANFTVPTPIQHQSIPTALEGKDLIGIAQTGTGKTLAFGIPMIQRLGNGAGVGLIIAPTRELAIQIDEAFRKIGQTLGLKTVVLIGGESMGRQVSGLRRNPHVIVATPGRLIDHLEQRTASLAKVGILVLDEADRMFDMGFAPQIKKILEKVPKNRQTMLFSATMPAEIMKIAAVHMQLPIRVEVAPSGTVSELVEQEIIMVNKDGKPAALQKLLNEHRGSVLVFSRTKHGAKKITRTVELAGFSAAEIHSNKSLGQRRLALAGFKTGKYRVLVATDIAARGIDVQNIELVVNYDLPDNPDDYVHRIGRTARAGRSGKAISLATPDQRRDIQIIERIIRKTLKVTYAAGVTAQTVAPRPVSSHQSYNHGSARPKSYGRRPFQRQGGQSRPSRSPYQRKGSFRRRAA